MITSDVRTIDMFSGAGGSSTGAQNAGAKIVAAFDNWEPAVRTYSANFPEVKVFKEDIRDLSPQKIRKEIGDIDLIIASPECTNHSVAKGGKERDELSRMTAFEVIRFAREFDPKWIVIENVVSMQSWSKHQKLLDDLWELGYFVRQVKLNAKDFGVPQSRRRLFLLCSKSFYVNEPRQTYEISKSVEDILDFSDKYQMTPLLTPKRALPTIERAERAIETLGKNSPFILVYYGTDKGGGWQSIDRPLRTITTLDRFALVMPSKTGHFMRMLQPEELKLAMGFNSEFSLDVTKNTRRQKIKLLGNGVCPPVMENVVRAMISKG